MPWIPFTKLHGLGNDFVLIDERDEAVQPAEEVVTLDQLGRAQRLATIRAIADRKRGVGFDQLLVLRSSPRVHAALDIYNADGSMAEMCGNGLRAAALYLWACGKLADPKLVIETAAGDRQARRLGPLLIQDVIECEMGVPRLKSLPPKIKKGVKLGSRLLRPTIVDVGNPHAVVFAAPKNINQLTLWGRRIETHPAFPRRTNVEFVRAQDKHIIDVQVWERGVGVTEACGTGAVAAAVAAIQTGLAQSPVEVRFPGGAAEVRWDGPSCPAFLRGSAAIVYEGRWLVPKAERR